MIKKPIFEKDDHAWFVFGREKERYDTVIDTNEYLIISGDHYLLLDPGGTEIFPNVVSAVSEVIDVGKITSFFCSHQDPDVMSSLPLWMGLCPKAKVYLPAIWSGFIAHFGHEYVDNFVKVPDEGTEIPLTGDMPNLKLIPAHYCHSSGNFSLYDPAAKVLYSGDVGAAFVPRESNELEVVNFNEHVQYMEPYHRRWMPSQQALQEWVKRVRDLEVEMICPQHGSIISGDNVTLFLDWLEQLEVGVSNS